MKKKCVLVMLFTLVMLSVCSCGIVDISAQSVGKKETCKDESSKKESSKKESSQKESSNEEKVSDLIHKEASFAEDEYAKAYDAYESYVEKNKINSVALIDLNGVGPLEAVYIKGLQYHVITMEGNDVREVTLYEDGKYPSVFCRSFTGLERAEGNTFNEFQYVPGKNMIRYRMKMTDKVLDYDSYQFDFEFMDSCDYYVDLYTMEEVFRTELIKKNYSGQGTGDYMNMYHGDTVLSFTKFSEGLNETEFSELRTCSVFYSSVSEAYEKRNSDSVNELNIYNDFINGNVKARFGVKSETDIYSEIFDYMTIDEFLEDRYIMEDYICSYENDWNMDGIKDLELWDYECRYLFTVMDGELVYLCSGDGTARQYSFAEHNDEGYGVYSDVTHSGRTTHQFARYDKCFRINDFFELNEFYWDDDEENAFCIYRDEIIDTEDLYDFQTEWFG